MCIQVFFVRQGKLIERDVSVFPFFDSHEEIFASFVGRFYAKSYKTETNICAYWYRYRLTWGLLDVVFTRHLEERKRISRTRY